MQVEQWFDTPENKGLLAICARKSIRSSGIAMLIWGLINIGLGIHWITISLINIPVLLIGLLMLASGIFALAHPCHIISLLMAIVSLLLLIWNLLITMLNLMVGVPPNVFIIIFPLAITIFFFKQYFRLMPVKNQISTVTPQEIKRGTDLCKSIRRKKAKREPDLVQSTNRQCGIQLMPDRALCFQGKLVRAFVMQKQEFWDTIANIEAQKLKMVVRHPLGKLTFSFDKKNSEKLRVWLDTETEQTPDA